MFHRPRPKTLFPLLVAGTMAGLGFLSPAPAAATPNGTVVGGVVTAFDYDDFSDPGTLQLVGVATTAPDNASAHALRLTSSIIGAGAAWRQEPAFVAGEFSTTFVMNLNNLGALSGLPPGGDGFAFVIQNQSPTAIGKGGCELGYGGILRGVAVEFDTFKNDYYCGLGETSANQISVHVNQGDPDGPLSPHESTSIASTGMSLPIDLKSGAHTVNIRYENRALRVFIDSMVKPVVAVTVDLAQVIDLDNGRAWIGFTASDASSWANFDILSWSYQGRAGGAKGCVSAELTAPVGGLACIRNGTQVCTDDGWKEVHAGCGNDHTCSCGELVSSEGVEMVTTECAGRACGENGHRWVCTADDWLDTGADCTGSENHAFSEMSTVCGAVGTFCGNDPAITLGHPNKRYTCPYAGAPPSRVIDCDDAACTHRDGGDYCGVNDGAGRTGSSEVDPAVTCQAKGTFCGGGYVNGGNPDTLYACDGAGVIAVPVRGCSLGCIVKSSPTGDKCLGPVALVMGGADLDCTVQMDDAGNLACPKATGCYITPLPICGKHLINLMAELPSAPSGPVLRVNGLDLANQPIVPSNLYVCTLDQAGKAPRISTHDDVSGDGHCIDKIVSKGFHDWQAGCRSRDAISSSPYVRDSCCSVNDPRCDVSHDPTPVAPAPIGAMATCFVAGNYCGSNRDAVQYGDASTLYECVNPKKTIGQPAHSSRQCSHGCLIGGGSTWNDACTPTCNSAGTFCSNDKIPGTNQDAVSDGEPGQLYYCAAADAPPLRVPCAACAAGAPPGAGVSYAQSIAPGQDSTCKVVPFCTSGEGLFCGGTADVVTGENGTLYQCTGTGKQGTPALRCGAGKCAPDPAPVSGLPVAGACVLSNVCPPGPNGIGGVYEKRDLLRPYDKGDYATTYRRSRYFCNGHFLQGTLPDGTADKDPTHLYRCDAAGGAPVLMPDCENGCTLSERQLEHGDHNGCLDPVNASPICQHDKTITVLPQHPDVLNYIIWGKYEQDQCSDSIAYPPQSCHMGPLCTAPSSTPVCGKHGVTCGSPDVLYTCDLADPGYPVAKVAQNGVCGDGLCGVELAPAADHCVASGQAQTTLCINPIGQPGHYCGGHDIQGGDPGTLYYCDYPAGTSYPAPPIAPSSLGIQPPPWWQAWWPAWPEQPKASQDCNWFIPADEPPPVPVCLSLPGNTDVSHGVTRHADLCNNPAAALATAWKWWNLSKPSTRVFENSKDDTYDTDLVPSGVGVETVGGALDVKVTFPHPSAYLGTVGDRETAPYGYAPIFLDMTTRRIFRFFHLRHTSANPEFVKYNPQVLDLCTTYQAGTVVGYMGGGDPSKLPQDSSTGFPDYSTGPHFCVQYSKVTGEGTDVTWNALVASPSSPPAMVQRDVEILNSKISPGMRASEPCQSLIQAVLP